MDPTVLHVVKGSPSIEELAALTVALLVLAAAPGDAAGGERPAAARWRRPERVGGFEGPRTWQSAPR